MTAPAPRGEHVADLLPAYINGTLDHTEVGRVRRHLAACETCAAERRAWSAVGDAAPLAFEPAALPSLALLDRVWAEIDAPAPRTRPAALAALRRYAGHVGQLTRAQVRLVPRGIWIASALTMVGGVFLALVAAVTQRDPQRAAHAALVLGVFAPLVAAIGAAYVYGPQSDAGLELALATPTSPRLVLVTRLALVVGFDLALSIAGSLLLILLDRGSFAGIVGMWMGPLLLLSGVSLVLSLLISAVAAVTGAIVMWFTRLLAAAATASGGRLHDLQAPLQAFWQTSPALILVALALVAVAVLYVPRQERLPTVA